MLHLPLQRRPRADQSRMHFSYPTRRPADLLPRVERPRLLEERARKRIHQVARPHEWRPKLIDWLEQPIMRATGRGVEL
jgi:hypothetical protein